MRKNVAGQFVSFQMISKTDGSDVMSGTPAVYYTIDGGTQGTGGGTSTHEGNGQWSYAPSQTETNGNQVAYTMVLTGAISQTVNVYPVSYDPTDSVRAGLTALPNAAADAAGGLPISDAGGLDLDTLLGYLTAAVATAAELSKVPKSDGTSTWNATALASINAEADTALSDYGALKPTVVGRTLDVNLTGEAGIDLDNTSGTLAKGTEITGFNDIAATEIVSAGAITTLAGAVVNVDTVDTCTTNTDMRGTDGANTVAPDNATITTINSKLPALVGGRVNASVGAYQTGLHPFDAVRSAHNTNNTFGGTLNKLHEFVGNEYAVSDTTPTTTQIDTTMPNIDVSGMDVNFVNGSANSGISRTVTSTAWTGTLLTLNFDEAFPATPINGDNFILNVAAGHGHSISEISDGVRVEMDANSTQLAKLGTPAGASISADIAAVSTLLTTTGVALTASERNSVAAAILAYDMGNTRTVEEALAFLRNKWTISGTTLTVYDTDDTSVLWTSTIVKTAGDPVSSSDPA